MATVSEEPITQTKETIKKKDSILIKIEKLLANKAEAAKANNQKFAIFSHPCPDPDAISSMMGMAFLLKKQYDVEVDCFSDGVISHPENRAMHNLLDPDLKLVETYVGANYCCNIVVDTIPSHAAADKELNFDLVIDHHKIAPNGGFKGIYYNIKAGSCAATVYQLIKNFNLHFDEDNQRDTQVATALMIGIRSDTNEFMSDDTTEMEFTTYTELFPCRDPVVLKQIINYTIPKPWLEAIKQVAAQAGGEDDIGIFGVGFLASSQRDLIAFLADFMQTWNETSIVFAVIDGNRIEASVRSTNTHLNIPIFCKTLGGDTGDGGGKLGKGAYHYPLGSFCVGEAEEQEIKERMWQFVLLRESKKIKQALKK